MIVSEKKKEPPYNKLSVRESLASMNARAASNTYEYVSEVDNLYATVSNYCYLQYEVENGLSGINCTDRYRSLAVTLTLISLLLYM